jgi:hypothetical protein
MGVLLLIVLSSVTSVDRLARTDYESLFQRALVTFALARTLNGVISVVQGTEVALQPAGVGLTLTPGQVLDPVNDLVERFSWIMLGATLSLGIQHVLLDVGQWWGFRLLVALLGGAWLWLRLRGAQQRPLSRDLLFRVLILVLFLRFAVPLTLILNEALFDLFLEPRYLESTELIENAGSQIEQAGAGPALPEEQGELSLMESLQRSLDSARESMNFGQRVEYIKERASAIVEHLIQLSVLFIVQTGLLPIAFLWLLLQMLKRLISPSND